MMNVLEAIAAMREGKRIKKGDWNSYYAYYENDGYFLHNKENDTDSDLTIYELTDLESYDEVEDLLDLEYEIYESENDKLIRRGKLLEISLFCHDFVNKYCDKDCPLRMFCPESTTIERMVYNNETIENSDIDNMYKALKEYRGV